MRGRSEPLPLSQAISELVALRGLARVQGAAELESAWLGVVGGKFAAQTRVMGIRRGTLEIGVSNAPLLSELNSFHRESLLMAFDQQYPQLRVRNLKFRLCGDLPSKSSAAGISPAN